MKFQKQKVLDVLDAYGGELIAGTFMDSEGNCCVQGVLVKAVNDITPVNGKYLSRIDIARHFEGTWVHYGMTENEWMALRDANDNASEDERRAAINFTIERIAEGYYADALNSPAA